MGVANHLTVAPGSQRRLGIYLGLLAGAAAALLLARWSTPNFLTFDNMFVVVRAASITGIVAVGMSYVTISGNLFALSAGQLSALLSVVYALMVRGNLGVAVSCIGVCAVAVLAGSCRATPLRSFETRSSRRSLSAPCSSGWPPT